MSPRTALAAIALGLAALTFAAYWPAYGYDFQRHEGYVWDDDDHYLHDPLIHADDGWWRSFLDPQPGVVGVEGGGVVWNYWPMTRLSFWLDLRLFGTYDDGRPDLRASHVVNVLLHACNAVLLWLVLRGLALPGALLAATLFAVHPVTVESVAWLTERNGLLSTLWFLLALAAWIRFREAPSPGRYASVVGAFLLALLSKTTSVMFPVLLALLHEARGGAWTRREVLRLAPLFGLSLVAGVTSIVFEGYIGSRGAAFEASFGERLAGAGRIPWAYLANLLWPLDLAFNYPRWRIDAASPAAYLPGVVLAAVGLALVALRRRAAVRPAFLAVGAFVTALFPVLGFFNVYGMRYAHVADHWVYLASMPVLAGLAAGATGAARRLGPTLRPAAIAAAALLVTGLASLTWQQSGAYTDRETLWRHTLAREPDSFLAHNNLGTLLLAERRYADAMAHFRRATEIDPSLPEPWVNLGNTIDASTGDMARAVPYWREAVERDPRQAKALFNLAAHASNSGRPLEAEGLLVRALEAQPQYGRALELLARIHRAQGRPRATLPFVDRAENPPIVVDDGRRGVARRIWAGLAAMFAFAAFVGRGERNAAD